MSGWEAIVLVLVVGAVLAAAILLYRSAPSAAERRFGRSVLARLPKPLRTRMPRSGRELGAVVFELLVLTALLTGAAVQLWGWSFAHALGETFLIFVVAPVDWLRRRVRKEEQEAEIVEVPLPPHEPYRHDIERMFR